MPSYFAAATAERPVRFERDAPVVTSLIGRLQFRSGPLKRPFMIAFDATNGTELWQTRNGNISNAPETYLVDGRQHVLVAVNDTLYAFRVY